MNNKMWEHNSTIQEPSIEISWSIWDIYKELLKTQWEKKKGELDVKTVKNDLIVDTHENNAWDDDVLTWELAYLYGLSW